MKTTQPPITSDQELAGQYFPTNHDSRCFSVGVEQVRIAPTVPATGSTP